MILSWALDRGSIARDFTRAWIICLAVPNVFGRNSKEAGHTQLKIYEL